MTNFLVRLFIKDRENTHDPKVRTAYGILGSITGIVCNLLLCAAKLVIGGLSGSIAVTADAFNNLSDIASSAISLLGFKLGKKPADAQHPFGHGRFEYLSALFIALLIMVLAVELGISSFEKILQPEKPQFSIISLVVLLLAVGVKLWLSAFNKKLGKKIDSASMAATAVDSLNDVLSTSAAIISMLAVLVIDFPLDGYLGVVVACFVMYSGFTIARDTINPLLGEAPPKELVEAIKEELLSNQYVLSIHDLTVHNYGPGRRFASVHVEVPGNANIIDVHNMIDQAELKILNQMGIVITIHMDPIDTDDAKTNRLRDMAKEAIEKIDERLSLHDFRIIDGSSRIVLLFDVVLPPGYPTDPEKLQERIQQEISSIDPIYHCVIHIDYDYAIAK